MALHLDRRAAGLAEEVAGRADDVLLTIEELAAWLAVAPISIRRWTEAGIGPKVTRMGLRALRYRKSDVKAWLEARAAARAEA